MLAGMFSKKIDLDASVVVLDANYQQLQLISFSQLKGEGVRHTGDNTTGVRGGGDRHN